MHKTRVARRLGTVAALASVTLVALATSALAHVTVSSPGATQGGYATVSMKVSTESDTASTIGLKLQLPTDTPLASVSVQPMPGWTFTVEEATLPTPVKTDDGEITQAPSVITWTATDGGIKPGEFDTFNISVGPLPKQDSVTFKAIQTYSDGNVVNWVEEGTGSTEPEFPAPKLAIAAASGDGHGDTATTGAATTEPDTATAAADTDSGSGLGITGIVLGGLGLLAGGAALALVLRRNRLLTGATEGK